MNKKQISRTIKMFFLFLVCIFCLSLVSCNASDPNKISRLKEICAGKINDASSARFKDLKYANTNTEELWVGEISTKKPDGMYKNFNPISAAIDKKTGKTMCEIAELDKIDEAFDKAFSKKEPTASNIAGTWTGSLEGDGEMVIKTMPTGFDVALSVTGETAGGSSCGGAIEGSGTLFGNTLTLTKKEDNQVCTITIKFVGDTANIDEDNCMNYHGAACGFYGSLKKLK
jgi:hypothetical protein